MWLRLLLQLLPLLRELIGFAKSDGDCPDGICEETSAKLDEVEAELAAKGGPSAQGIGDIFDCLDKPRAMDWLKEGLSILFDALRGCPPSA